MNAVILAGGLGTRIVEDTSSRPKPMIVIGGRPMLWHIMTVYSHLRATDFIICCGHKGYLIKKYFANYLLHMSDVTFDMQQNKMAVHQRNADPWRITLIDAGDATQTGRRIKPIGDYLYDSPFCMTSGDGISDINITGSINSHERHGRLATITPAQLPGRFGCLGLEGTRISRFLEKPHGEGGWINGGFFVLSPKVIDYIDGDKTLWEREPLKGLLGAANSKPAFMASFGSRWTRSGIGPISMRSGAPPATRHAKCGLRRATLGREGGYTVQVSAILGVNGCRLGRNSAQAASPVVRLGVKF